MARPSANQLDRSLAELTISLTRAREERAAALRDGHTGEWVQQVQVPLSGLLGTGWGSADAPVTFDVPFLYAADQRAVPFQTPHFSYGVEFTSTPVGPVVATASVLQWLRSDEGWIVGAMIRYCISQPNPVTIGGVPQPPQPYSATAHLTFEGYASPAEGDEFAS